MSLLCLNPSNGFPCLPEQKLKSYKASQRLASLTRLIPSLLLWPHCACHTCSFLCTGCSAHTSLNLYSSVTFTTRPTLMPHKRVTDAYHLCHVVQRDSRVYGGGSDIQAKKQIEGTQSPKFPLSYCLGWAWMVCTRHGQSTSSLLFRWMGYLCEFMIAETPCLLWTRYLCPPPDPKIHMLKPNASCHGIRKWGFWDVLRS